METSKDFGMSSGFETAPDITRDSADVQLALWGEPIREHPDYLSKQLVTYIGNKRALLGQIESAVIKAKQRLGKDRLRVFDVFSGSGVVTRCLKRHAEYVAANDIEDFAAVISRCFLSNIRTVNIPLLKELVREINEKVETQKFETGFIEKLYAPRCEDDIKKHERVFYTRDNARRLDRYRRLIDMVPTSCRNLLLGPLLSEASIHANTAGVFKGFYKDRRTQIGSFGGSNADALVRIKGKIEIEVPILSRFESEIEVFQGDANKVARQVKNLDVAYLDPPYNQHPYGSNYFMLNLLVHYQEPSHISSVSGIPVDWRRSDYNVRSLSLDRLSDLVNALDARILLISFNNEGFISPGQMRSMLEKVGKVEIVEMHYNTFRGCRNLRDRKIHVTEQLFFVERK